MRWHPDRLLWRSFRARRARIFERPARTAPIPRIGESGQGMVEYLILLFACMLGLLAILAPMCHGIHVYMKSIYFCVSLPYP